MKKKKFRSYSQKKNNSYKSLESTIHTRYLVLTILVLFCFGILTTKLYQVQILKSSQYQQAVYELSNTIIEGPTAPRGRIYDRNGKLLVDNTPVKVISYKKPTGVTTTSEIEMAYKVASLIEVDFRDMNIEELKYFWILNHTEEADAKITSEEWKALEERKITSEDILNLKEERITEEELNRYQDIDREAAYIYTLMNDGYSFAEKVIKSKKVTDEEYAVIAENLEDLQGFTTHLDWERYYPYGDTFRSILGSVSSSESGVPLELKDSYLALGYQLTDRVGVSYLEEQYETILRGKKTKYRLLDNGSYELVEEGERGNDIVLTIDIELQKALEKIIDEELIASKKDPYTEFMDRSFVVIQNPNTGEILAMVGRKIEKVNGKYVASDYSPGVINAIITPGSSVKAASHMVGYVTGNLSIGEVRNDACIKLAATPLKCSFKTYGNINDAEALKYSSNTYQFQTAMKVGGATYRYNQPLIIDESAFDTYRKVFAEFGLGVKTEIDLPGEIEGYKGTSRQAGLLLDFSIGQYDNYTPIQISQYISTVANGGSRMKPYLLKSVYKPTKEKLTEVLFQNSPTVLNTVNADKKYMDRIQEGLRMVLAPGGTGASYIDQKYQAAGKTGTSQSFIDTDGDGKIDRETLSAILVAYAPYKNPEVSFTVITPNVANKNVTTQQMSKVNRRLSQKVSQKYFEIYK